MIASFNRLMGPFKRRLMLMVGRAVLRLIKDDTGLQRVQLVALDGETLDEVERFQEYGFTSVPHPDAEAMLVSIGGVRAHAIVIAVDDRRYRLRGLAGGEVALYTDEDQKPGGHRIVLRRNQEIEVHAQKYTIDVGDGANVLTMTPAGTDWKMADYEAHN